MSDRAVWCRCVRPERHLERSGSVYVMFCDVASGGVRWHGRLHQRSAWSWASGGQRGWRPPDEVARALEAKLVKSGDLEPPGVFDYPP